jgi:hypothetical protein
MNRLVREHYPVSKLPEDLRQGFEGKHEVRVTIDAEASGVETQARSAPPRSLEQLFALGRPVFNTLEEIDDHLNALRQEWD